MTFSQYVSPQYMSDRFAELDRCIKALGVLADRVNKLSDDVDELKSAGTSRMTSRNHNNSRSAMKGESPMPGITYEVEVTKTQQYVEDWERTALCCPECGWQGLCAARSGESYNDLDNMYVCTNCGACMALEFETPAIVQGAKHQARLAAIRQASWVLAQGTVGRGD